MAEAVGLISGVITIAAAVNEALKSAQAIRCASEDFERLQEQLLQFQDLVKTVKENERYRCAGVTSALLGAERTIQRLNQLVQIRLLKKVEGTSRVRRRAWARNKSKILKLQDALKEHRAELVAAMTASNLPTSNVLQTETQSVSRDIRTSEETACSIDKRLHDIQRSIAATQNAIFSQNNAVHCVLRCMPCSQERQLTPSEHRSAFTKHTHWTLPSISFQDSSSGSRDGTTQRWSHTGGEVLRERKKSPEPQSLFEMSAKFFPEVYTTDQRLPPSCLMVISSFEEHLSENSKRNLYRLFYQKSPRQWCRINISIKIPRSSKYWAASKTPQDEFKTMETLTPEVYSTLPYSLITQVQPALLTLPSVEQDAKLSFTLSEQNSIIIEYYSPKARTLAIQSPYLETWRDVLTFLDDIGCPRYFESEVTQLEIFDPPCHFTSWCKGMLVYETMFMRPVPSPEMIYNIRLLHCMKGKPGFAKLVGVVTDKHNTQAKSFLIEFPRARHRLEFITQGQPLPWTRRERWARQLIECVCEAHSKGFVIGTLLRFGSPVVIEGTDSILLWHFSSKFSMGYNFDLYYPPEFQHYKYASKGMSEADSGDITTKTDLYHLGDVLWLLAENLPRTHSSPVCIRNKCPDLVNSECDDSHRNPVTLPELSADVPQYYKDIVNSCRAENPQDRVCARTLLEWFPPLTQYEHLPDENNEVQNMEIADISNGLLKSKTCDICRSRCGKVFFHCGVCLMGDFDICNKCYESGAHCYEKEHLLEQNRKIGSWTVPWKYHSSVNKSGTREIIEL